MSPLAPFAVNGLWLLASLPAAVAHRRARRQVARVQEAVLMRILRDNRESQFGRRHGFAEITSVADFRGRVPLSSYDDYTAAVAAIGRGEKKILTAAAVSLLEPTGGSAGGSKLIPYTAPLQAEFRRGIAPWIAGLFLAMPELLGGTAYWSVSPAVRSGERTGGGIPVGFADDSDYLGGFGRLFARVVQAVPPMVREIGGTDGFWYATLLFLLRSRSLRLISAWNPTFLTILAERLATDHQRLAEDLATGRFAPPGDVPPETLRALGGRLSPDPRRGEEVLRVFAGGGSRGSIHARLWPHLRLVSCWTEGNAAPHVAELAALFPQARLQGKGLIATEGMVSFPLPGRPGACLALGSHFFEFLPVDDGDPLLAQELELGRVYSVVLTTGGGLYRYRLGDLVEVVGRDEECPCLRFLGREAAISDHFGEKLHEHHVSRALAAAVAGTGTAARFVLVALEAEGAPAYTLFVEAEGAGESQLLRLGELLDRGLCENFHYRYCRELGQLAPLRVFRIERDGREAFLAGCRSRGQRLGEVKPTSLHRLAGWSREFPGRFLGPEGTEPNGKAHVREAAS